MKAHALPVAGDLPAAARSAICNGMGPKAGRGAFSRLFCGAVRAFLKIVGASLLFDACGDDHDLHYACGGTEDDRAFADLIFLGSMLEVPKQNILLRMPTIKLAVNVMALLCYAGVREGGGLGPFKYRGDGPRTIEQVVEELV